MTHVAAAIAKLSKAIAERPEAARSKNASATATLDDALKFGVVGPNGERVATDMPVAMGGSASAPNPGWLLRASLASCNATTIALRAAQLGLTLRTLEVSVESESDQRGLLGLDDNVSAALRNLRVRVKIGAPGATPAQLRELVAWAEAHSPVGCTIGPLAGTPSDVEVV